MSGFTRSHIDSIGCRLLNGLPPVRIMSELFDVSKTPPTNNQGLLWNAAQEMWVPGALVSAGVSELSVADLTDVDNGAAPGVAGTTLVSNGAGAFITRQLALNDLSDVNQAATAGQVLVKGGGTEFVAGDVFPAASVQINNVAPTAADVLQFNGTNWALINFATAANTWLATLGALNTSVFGYGSVGFFSGLSTLDQIYPTVAIPGIRFNTSGDADSDEAGFLYRTMSYPTQMRQMEMIVDGRRVMSVNPFVRKVFLGSDLFPGVAATSSDSLWNSGDVTTVVDSVVLGDGHYARSSETVLLGKLNLVRTDCVGSTLVGNRNVAERRAALMLGNNNFAQTGSSANLITIGNYNTIGLIGGLAGNGEAMAIGQSNVMTNCVRSMLIGGRLGGALADTFGVRNSEINSCDSGLLFGKGCWSNNASFSVNIGHHNTVTNNNATCIGQNNTVSGDSAFCIGKGNTVTGNSAVCIGQNLNASVANSCNLSRVQKAMTGSDMPAFFRGNELFASTSGTSLSYQAAYSGTAIVLELFGDMVAFTATYWALRFNLSSTETIFIGGIEGSCTIAGRAFPGFGEIPNAFPSYVDFYFTPSLPPFLADFRTYHNVVGGGGMSPTPAGTAGGHFAWNIRDKPPSMLAMRFETGGVTAVGLNMLWSGTLMVHMTGSITA